MHHAKFDYQRKKKTRIVCMFSFFLVFEKHRELRKIIEVLIADDRVFKVRKKPDRDAVLARLRKYRGKLPADFKFDREEANARY